LHNIGAFTNKETITNISAYMVANGMPAMTSMRAFLSLEAGMGPIVDAASAASAFHVALSAVTLKAPIYDPDKIICIGMNYVDHCTEQNVPVPDEPTVFSKFPSSIIAPGEPIMITPEIKKLDWEVELAIVIGKEGRRISKEDAMSYVAGYTTCHDVSARYLQLEKNGGQWLVGKTMDTFCPLGPAIVTPDEISDVHNLGLRTRVNGITRQDSNTNQMVFKTEDVVAWCSKFFTLKVGDVIITGTPPGVGCFMKPPMFLKAGDVVDVEIDEIGTITNPVVAEADFPKAKL
jgi:2-keto-4-pentenoate hydratase/2-oxohepta-3-ene-1,7-dioic acid hydratase in catechol pathway